MKFTEPTLSNVELFDEEALQRRLLRSDRPIVFLFGAPLTAPESAGQPGVPGVAGMLDLINAELDKAVQVSDGDFGAAYREGFGRVNSERGVDVANAIVRRAVLKARRERNPTFSEIERASPPGAFEPHCKVIEADHRGWHLRPSLAALGSILTGYRNQFDETVLTTNFDPLIEAAIRHARPASEIRATALHSDGTLHTSLGQGHHVVYLHGRWYGSDMLHTSTQIKQERPQLRNSLRRLLKDKLLAVFAYSGWDDAMMRALGELANDHDSYQDILWTFYQKDQYTIERTSGELVSKLRQAHDRGRVTYYKDIDVHKFLPRLLEGLRNGGIATKSVADGTHAEAPTSATGSASPADDDDDAATEPESWTINYATGGPTRIVPDSATVTGAGVFVIGEMPAGSPGAFLLDTTTRSWAAKTTKLGGYRNAVSYWTGTDVLIYDQFLRRVVRYSPNDDTIVAWGSIHGAPTARMGASVTFSGNDLFVWGGASEDRFLGDGARYNLEEDAWYPMASLAAPQARADHGAAWCGDRLLIFGGRFGSSIWDFCGDGAMYIPSRTGAPTWLPLESEAAPSPRVAPTIQYHKGQAFVWGGYGWRSSIPDKSSEERPVPLPTGATYNMAERKWRQVHPRANRTHARCIPAAGGIVCWGGLHRQVASNTGDLYDIDVDSWKAIGAQTGVARRSNHLMVDIGAGIIIHGGQGAHGEDLSDTHLLRVPAVQVAVSAQLSGSQALESEHTRGTHDPLGREKHDQVRDKPTVRLVDMDATLLSSNQRRGVWVIVFATIFLLLLLIVDNRHSSISIRMSAELAAFCQFCDVLAIASESCGCSPQDRAAREWICSMSAPPIDLTRCVKPLSSATEAMSAAHDARVCLKAQLMVHPDLMREFTRLSYDPIQQASYEAMCPQSVPDAQPAVRRPPDSSHVRIGASSTVSADRDLTIRSNAVDVGDKSRLEAGRDLTIQSR